MQMCLGHLRCSMGFLYQLSLPPTAIVQPLARKDQVWCCTPRSCMAMQTEPQEILPPIYFYFMCVDVLPVHVVCTTLRVFMEARSRHQINVQIIVNHQVDGRN